VEKSRRSLLELQAELVAVESTGQASNSIPISRVSHVSLKDITNVNYERDLTNGTKRTGRTRRNELNNHIVSRGVFEMKGTN